MTDPIIDYLSSRSGMRPDLVAALASEILTDSGRKDPRVRHLHRAVYKVPPSHRPWAKVAATHEFHVLAPDMLARLGELLLKPGQMSGLNDRIDGLVAQSVISRMAADNDFPFWLVGRDMTDMLARTDGLERPNLDTEARLPFKSLTFVPPSGAITLPDGDTLEMVSLADIRLEDSEACGFLVRARPGPDDTGRRFYVCGMTGRGYSLYSRIPVDADGSVTDPSSQPFVLHASEEREDGREEELSRQSTVAVVGWALRFLTALNAAPEVAEDRLLEKSRKAKGGKRALDFWSCRWLGRKFTVAGGSPRSGGTHASPHTHWRRGHFARLRCGPGRSDTRVTWRKPVLVNPAEVSPK